MRHLESLNVTTVTHFIWGRSCVHLQYTYQRLAINRRRPSQKVSDLLNFLPPHYVPGWNFIRKMGHKIAHKLLCLNIDRGGAKNVSLYKRRKLFLDLPMSQRLNPFINGTQADITNALLKKSDMMKQNKIWAMQILQMRHPRIALYFYYPRVYRRCPP